MIRLSNTRIHYLLPHIVMAADLKQQMRILETEKKATEALLRQQREILRKEQAQLSRDISQMHTQKSKVSSEISKLG